jgi:hypothetical protein
MEVLNSSTEDDFDLQFCQSLINRDNSLSESGCGSDLEINEDDVPSGVAAGKVPGRAVAVAVVPCSACLRQIKADPVAARKYLLGLEELLHRAE